MIHPARGKCWEEIKKPGIQNSEARLYYEMEPNWNFCVNPFHFKYFFGKCDFSNKLENHSNSWGCRLSVFFGTENAHVLGRSINRT